MGSETQASGARFSGCGSHVEDINRAVSDILRRSVDGGSLHDVLDFALERVLAMDWLCFGGRGVIFLTSESGDTLEMAVSRGLPAQLLTECASVPFGTCLCGMAADARDVIVVDCVDNRHLPTGEASHGHYCIPMIVGDRVLGVINIYLSADHRCVRYERDMLVAVGDVLAGLVERARADDEVREQASKLEAILGSFDGLIYTASPDYRIEYMNDRFIELVGGDPVGRTCYEAIHKRGDVCPWCTNERVFAGETVRWEVQMRLDGRHYMVVNQPIVHPDGTMSKLSMSSDITERKLAELDLVKALEDNAATLDGVVRALAAATSLRDPYTAIHQERVSRFVVAMAEDMGLTLEVTEGLRIAGLLHDIGKIAVPAEILSKPGALTDMEMGIVRTHSGVGFSMLEHVPFKRPIAKSVLQHHERLDGSGYPDGLCGDEIVVEARLLAVADVVEAMASHRPYRPAGGVEAAIAEVSRGSGRLYDPKVVESCVRVLSNGTFSF